MSKKRGRYAVKLAGVALLAAAALAVGATGATIRHNMSMTNKIKTQTIGVEIEEDFEGEAKTKKVSFKSTGTADAFLRISYAEYWEYEYEVEDEDGNKDTRTILLPNTDSEGNNLTELVWSSPDDWTLCSDGWYYYEKVLPAEATVSDVITKVTFLEFEDVRYLTAEYNLHFQAEVVQASDEWQVCKDAALEVFKKAPDGDGAPSGWDTDKYKAKISWSD